MEYNEVVRRRRMVRNYLPDPVTREQIERVVETMRHAPSAGFTQGTAVVVVTGEETRAHIARLAGEPGYLARGFDPWISRAPVHLVLTVSEHAYRERYREPDKLGPEGVLDWPVPYWWIDAGATLMLLLLAAVDQGLAAGFLGVHAVPELGELLGIPPEHTPIGVLTLGHSAPDRRSSSLKRGRRPRSEVVHWERWTT